MTASVMKELKDLCVKHVRVRVFSYPYSRIFYAMDNITGKFFNFWILSFLPLFFCKTILVIWNTTAHDNFMLLLKLKLRWMVLTRKRIQLVLFVAHLYFRIWKTTITSPNIRWHRIRIHYTHFQPDKIERPSVTVMIQELEILHTFLIEQHCVKGVQIRRFS